MKYLSNIVTLGVLLFCSIAVRAQLDLKEDTFQIRTKYRPELSSAIKLRTEPAQKDTEKVNVDFNYSFLKKQIPVEFEVQPIQAARITQEALQRLRSGYVRLGGGTNGTPLAEVYYTSLRSKTAAWGVHLKHLSTVGVNSIDNSGHSQNFINLFGRKMSRTATWSAHLDYQKKVFNYYGLPAGVVILERFQNPKQEFNDVAGRIALVSNKVDTAKVRHDASLDYHYYFDAFESVENNAILKTHHRKYYGRELYSLKTDINYNGLSNALDTLNNTIVSASPEIYTIGKKWQLNVGITMTMELGDKERFYFYPLAEFKVNLVKNILIPYVGLGGGLIRNNYRSLSAINPFINPAITLANTNNPYEMYGGIRGAISSAISFNTSFRQQRLSSMPMFVRSNYAVISDGYLVSNPNNRFTPVYDTVNVTTLKAELVYHKTGKLRLMTGGEYNIYTTKNEIEAWYLPKLKANVSALYDMQDKLILSTDLFVISEQYARVDSSLTTSGKFESKKLGSFIDVNFGIEYRYTKRFSAFLKLNNIASIRYYKWEDYPLQLFNILGGLTYSF